MAPPTSPAHLQYGSAPLQLSLPSSRLQEKHWKLRDPQGLCGFLSSVPPLPLPPPLSPDPQPDEDDLAKPKGKRPCKTKHTEGEGGQDEAEGGGAKDEGNATVRKLRLRDPTDGFV